jgi:thiol-disulfide isomerase/thioredoxin
MTMLRFLPVLAAALVLVAGCGGDGDDPVAGGAGDLPGPVPAGVTFADAPATALDAPDFSVELLDGTPVTASELWQDRPLVLVFTASWCGQCKDIHAGVAEAVDAHDGAIGLLGVVAEDDVEPGKDYAADLDLGHPVAVANERIWLNYAAREPPLVVLVAKGGKVVRGFPGGVTAEKLAPQLDELIEK